MKETLIHCGWEWKYLQPVWKKCGGNSKSSKSVLIEPHDWAKPLFGMHFKYSIFYYRAICSFMGYSSIAKKCKKLRYPVANELIVKLWYNYKTVY